MFQRKLQFLLLICISSSIRAAEIPNCDYFDTIDLTFSEKLTNGSYKYEGVVIPSEQTGNYSYKILFEGTKITVKDHLRGCVCKIKPCIRYCCHRHRLDLANETKCTDEFNDYPEYIALEDGTKRKRNIRDHFVVQPGIRIKCNGTIHKNEFKPNDNWTLFENGSLYRSDDDVYLLKRDYCIQPKELVSLGWNYKVLPLNCLSHYDFFYVIWTSVFFLLLTICIYIFLIKRQHSYDKCCLCYLICYSINLLINILMDSENFLLGTNCYIVAFLTYFFGISTYFWMTVMSFDFWRIFFADTLVTIQNKKNNRLRFLKYSLFVFGMASVFLIITILADYYLDNLDISSNWKVGYAYYECYFKWYDWSRFVYWFGPAAVMLLINVTFIISTVRRIHIEYQRNRKALKELGHHNIKNNMIFTFYLRILIAEILNWLTEFSKVIYNIPKNAKDELYVILIHINLLYCILIFAVTVTRRDVRQLFARR